jgi:hypothetical protein
VPRLVVFFFVDTLVVSLKTMWNNIEAKVSAHIYQWKIKFGKLLTVW